LRPPRPPLRRGARRRRRGARAHGRGGRGGRRAPARRRDRAGAVAPQTPLRPCGTFPSPTRAPRLSSGARSSPPPMRFRSALLVVALAVVGGCAAPDELGEGGAGGVSVVQPGYYEA